MSIPVTKPFLPSREKLDRYIDQIYQSGWLTNNGPLVNKLTDRLADKFSSDNILLVANGTMALQIAYRTLLPPSDFDSKPIEAITSPFTFIATSNSLQWEGITPIFSDIDRNSWCLNPTNIASKVSEHTKLIVPIHVFGNTCAIDQIETIAKEHNLKTIYDASHAFGVNYDSKSILHYGDASIISLHATKLFHTAEGALIRFKKNEDYKKAKELINFGLNEDKKPNRLGINAKMNELEAALGLSAIDDIETLIAERKKIAAQYQVQLAGNPHIIKINLSSNQAYLPVLFDSETNLLKVINHLTRMCIEAKRYFHPSLDTVAHLSKEPSCPISIGVAERIACLPLYSGLKSSEVQMICNAINESLGIP